MPSYAEEQLAHLTEAGKQLNQRVKVDRVTTHRISLTVEAESTESLTDAYVRLVRKLQGHVSAIQSAGLDKERDHT